MTFNQFDGTPEWYTVDIIPAFGVLLRNEDMTIKFVLMVNKQGQTRLAQYYDFLSIEERVALEAETIRKCLTRNEMQVCGLLVCSWEAE